MRRKSKGLYLVRVPNLLGKNSGSALLNQVERDMHNANGSSDDRIRALFPGKQAGDFLLPHLTEAHGPWYEDADTIRRRLAWGRKKKRLLAWVEGQMFFELTLVERRCIHLYYFKGLNYRQAAQLLQVHPTSVYRAVQRGLRKLREAARDHPGY